MSVQGSFIPSLNKAPIKVMVAVPTKDMMHSHFAYCLQELVKYHAVRNIETVVEFNMGTLIGNQRETLASIALSIGATHIMWIDSDMMFPHNVCEVLLSHNHPFVACNYSTRALPLKSVAYNKMFDWNSVVEDDTSGLKAIEGIGFGCVLTSTDLFLWSHKPWFPITYSPTTEDYLGEDMNFCRMVSSLGYPMYVDLDLSKQVYHIGTAAYSRNHRPVDYPV